MIEVSDEDRVKEINLQSEIAKEQEYQDMMNMIYNNPEYFEQHQQSLQYQPDLHQATQCEVVIDPCVMQHNPPMYFVMYEDDLQLHHNNQPQQALYQPQVIQQHPPMYFVMIQDDLQLHHNNQPQQALYQPQVIQPHPSLQYNEFHHHCEPMKTSTP